MTAVRWAPPVLAYPPRTAVLTPEQAEVLTGICHGLQNATIGRRLGITSDAVRARLTHVYRSMQAHDRAHAVALAVSGQVEVVVSSRGAA